MITDQCLKLKFRSHFIALPASRRGHSGTEGGRTRATYFAEEGVFFRTSACPRFCIRRVLFCTHVRSMGRENPLTIHEIYAALTPSDFRSDWASKSAAAVVITSKACSRSSNVSVLIKEGVFLLLEKVSVFKK